MYSTHVLCTARPAVRYRLPRRPARPRPRNARARARARLMTLRAQARATPCQVHRSRRPQRARSKQSLRSMVQWSGWRAVVCGAEGVFSRSRYDFESDPRLPEPPCDYFSQPALQQRGCIGEAAVCHLCLCRSFCGGGLLIRRSPPLKVSTKQPAAIVPLPSDLA